MAFIEGSIQFQISRFDSNQENILYQGDAAPSVGAVELNNKKLGEGGFGAVYKGYLIDLDITVAVKKISRGSKQGRKEYITEVKVISSLRHRNLVQLIGWCHDKGEFLLVYEFMPNGSLDAHLFGKRKPLTWAVRIQSDLDKKQVECLMIVGLWCAHPDRSLRPSIRQAIHVLNFEATYPNLPSKMPVPLFHVPSPSVSSGEPSITTSIAVGR
ncbi:hypothetical protein FEM48_Zijuj08G0139600 [Ziziphus jujuba var. spinosa]|uniref:Protein kinase domain-containing protein n=1 Tax=Ziziphus jujuba var. spinosa TaxID=714518 RepID=A0A978UZI1_ZIZJJ|nr:hypothetical protein FEM48_Zijuj08G0139600 [Ziziphus jujuba var. spinosa]